MIETKTKVLAAIAYLSWLFYLISFLIYRSDEYQRDASFYQLHNTRAFTLNLISTIVSVFSTYANAAGAVRISYIGTLNFVVFIFMIWGIVYAALGKEDAMPGLDDLIGVFRK